MDLSALAAEGRDAVGEGREARTLDDGLPETRPDGSDMAALASLDPDLEFEGSFSQGEAATVVHTLAPDGSVLIEVRTGQRTDLRLEVDPHGTHDLGDIILLLTLTALIAALNPGGGPTDLCLATGSGLTDPDDPIGCAEIAGPGEDLTLALWIRWSSGDNEIRRKIWISDNEVLSATESGPAPLDEATADEEETTEPDMTGQDDAAEGFFAGGPYAFDQEPVTRSATRDAEIALDFANGRIEFDLAALDADDAQYLSGSDGTTPAPVALAEEQLRPGGSGPIKPGRLLEAFVALRVLRGPHVRVGLESSIRVPAAARVALRWAWERRADGL